MVTKNMLFRDGVMSDRERKNLSILDIIRKKGPISRTDISKLTGLNIVTVSHYIDNYIKRSLVFEKGCDVSTGGRKPTLVELNSAAFYVIGVDIGPINMIAVLSDLAANPIAKVKKPRPQGSMDEVISKVISIVNEIVDSSKIDMSKVKGVGLGISGVIDGKAGIVYDTDPVRGMTSGSYGMLKNRIEKEFAVPAYIGNDATVAAYGEKWLGLDHEVENVIYFYSDVGCGLIINGDIYCGAGGSAGEVRLNLASSDIQKVEWLKKDPNFFAPGSSIDCGIATNAKRLIKEGAKTKISELAKNKTEDVTTQIVIKAAKAGDKVALELIEDAAIGLGIKIAFFINLFNPEVVIVGGGIEEAGELLISRIRKTVNELAFEGPASLAKIIPARLGENSVSLGASLLVMREVFAAI